MVLVDSSFGYYLALYICMSFVLKTERVGLFKRRNRLSAFIFLSTLCTKNLK